MLESNLGGVLENVPGLGVSRVMAGPYGRNPGARQHAPSGRPAAGEPAAGPESGPRLELAFGEDYDWTWVPDASKPPWRSICHLELVFAHGRNGHGTGWFVDETTIITAAHNVHNPRAGRVTGMGVRPGLNLGGAGLEIGAFGVEADVHPNWVGSIGTPDQQLFDIAYVKIDDPSIGRFLGAFGLRVLTDHELAHGNLIVHSSGYPATKVPGSQWVDASRLSGFSANHVFYRLDTEIGNSGAPIFAAFANGQRQVIACHTHGTKDGGSNAGLRITDEIFDLVESWAT